MVFNSEKVKTRKSGKGKLVLFIIICVIIFLLGGAVYANSQLKLVNVGAYSCYWDPASSTKEVGPEPLPTNKTVTVKIDNGLTFLEIGEKLHDAGVIEDPNYFSCYVKKTGVGPKIQAGYFEIPVPISMEKLVTVLQTAEIPTVKVTIKEGLRADEIATVIDDAMGTDNPIEKFQRDEFIELLSDKTFIDQYSYIKGKTSLEGFLFPDTYEFAKDADAESIAKIMLSTFESKVLTPLESQFEQSKYDKYQIITIASMLEREATGDPQEQQMIADIIRRRNENGWNLAIDATILYEQKDWKHVISPQDKSRNTPYNSYLRKGLPPTPISNPGVNTVKAALSPKANNYWYYLHGNDGQVHYAVTYEEHVQNINKYLR